MLLEIRKDIAQSEHSQTYGSIDLKYKVLVQSGFNKNTVLQIVFFVHKFIAK